MVSFTISAKDKKEWMNSLLKRKSIHERKVKEMLSVYRGRANNFINEDHHQNFLNRLKSENLKLAACEEQIKELLFSKKYK